MSNDRFVIPALFGLSVIGVFVSFKQLFRFVESFQGMANIKIVAYSNRVYIATRLLAKKKKINSEKGRVDSVLISSYTSSLRFNAISDLEMSVLKWWGSSIVVDHLVRLKRRHHICILRGVFGVDDARVHADAIHFSLSVLLGDEFREHPLDGSDNCQQLLSTPPRLIVYCSSIVSGRLNMNHFADIDSARFLCLWL